MNKEKKNNKLVMWIFIVFLVLYLFPKLGDLFNGEIDNYDDNTFNIISSPV